MNKLGWKREREERGRDRESKEMLVMVTGGSGGPWRAESRYQRAMEASRALHLLI